MAAAPAPMRKHDDAMRADGDIQHSPERHRAQIDRDLVDLFRASQKVDDLLVLHLRKVLVERAHRIKRVRQVEADDLIDEGSEPLPRRPRSHRDRQHQREGLHLPQRLDGCVHARSRGDPIIHQDHRLAGDLQRGAVAAIQRGPAIQLPPHLCGDSLDLLGRDTRRANDLSIQISSIAGRDRSERQLCLAGHTQFPRKKYIQRSVQRRRNLKGHRNPTARHSQHDHIGTISKGLQPPGKLASSICTVFEDHFGVPPNLCSSFYARGLLVTVI